MHFARTCFGTLHRHVLSPLRTCIHRDCGISGAFGTRSSRALHRLDHFPPVSIYTVTIRHPTFRLSYVHRLHGHIHSFHFVYTYRCVFYVRADFHSRYRSRWNFSPHVSAPHFHRCVAFTSCGAVLVEVLRLSRLHRTHLPGILFVVYAHFGRYDLTARSPFSIRCDSRLLLAFRFLVGIFQCRQVGT